MIANDILATAETSGQYSTFLSALGMAGLTETLKGAGPYTVFAPNNAAFEKFPPMTISNLLDGDAERLKAVLGYHFALGEVNAGRFAGKRIRATTFSGETILVDGKSGFRVNGAKIVEPDIKASNGVIHGIDSLLWPSESEAAAGIA